ncbi:hypothetical protein B0H65DRAFT_251710 [Neurospora tetraspora]|uniref:Uncharacterized protein n=1 Tax=Neurospora tetraspora TaxID=94610 RepID=A0AAE0JA69_9PEZI|nr:hypothetical protein B0H65DRAFT_251710 [Neurospora tetraspora]
MDPTQSLRLPATDSRPPARPASGPPAVCPASTTTSHPQLINLALGPQPSCTPQAYLGKPARFSSRAGERESLTRPGRHEIGQGPCLLFFPSQDLGTPISLDMDFVADIVDSIETYPGVLLPGSIVLLCQQVCVLAFSLFLQLARHLPHSNKPRNPLCFATAAPVPDLLACLVESLALAKQVRRVSEKRIFGCRIYTYTFKRRPLISLPQLRL